MTCPGCTDNPNPPCDICGTHADVDHIDAWVYPPHGMPYTECAGHGCPRCRATIMERYRARRS